MQVVESSINTTKRNQQQHRQPTKILKQCGFKKFSSTYAETKGYDLHTKKCQGYEKASDTN
jgi:hypothetical protein